MASACSDSETKVHSFVWCIHPCIHPSMHDPSIIPSIHSSVHSSDHSFIHMFYDAVMRRWPKFVTLTVKFLATHSFIHSFTHSQPSWCQLSSKHKHRPAAFSTISNITNIFCLFSYESHVIFLVNSINIVASQKAEDCWNSAVWLATYINRSKIMYTSTHCTQKPQRSPSMH